MSGINYQFGYPAGDSLIQAVAGQLTDACGDDGVLACLGGGRFGFIFPAHQQSAAQRALLCGDQMREVVSQSEFFLGEQAVQISASVGVVAVDKRSHFAAAHEVLEELHKVLTQAKISGRDCVVSDGELDEETEKWAELATSGQLFDKTQAHDVMTPVTQVLWSHQSMEEALLVLEQSRFSCLPVVDRGGHLTGVLHEECLDQQELAVLASLAVTDVMDHDPPQLAESVSFEELLDFFGRESTRFVVVVRGNSPLGIVHCNDLAALSQPLPLDALAPDQPLTTDSSYLLIADGE